MKILLIVAGLCLAKTVAAGVTIRTAEENGITYRWFEEMVPMRDGVEILGKFWGETLGRVEI